MAGAAISGAELELALLRAELERQQKLLLRQTELERLTQELAETRRELEQVRRELGDARRVKFEPMPLELALLEDEPDGGT